MVLLLLQFICLYVKFYFNIIHKCHFKINIPNRNIRKQILQFLCSFCTWNFGWSIPAYCNGSQRSQDFDNFCVYTHNGLPNKLESLQNYL